MFRRLTSRRTLKWIGTIACAVLAVVFIASRWYQANVLLPLGAHGLQGSVRYGYVLLRDFDTSYQPSLWELAKRLDPPFGKFNHPKLDWWPRVFLQLVPDGSIRWWVSVPLWLPFLLLAVPTAWLWWIGRTPLPSQCKKCNYDLTGNTSGRCPECGAEILKGEAVSANDAGGGDAAGV